MLGCTRGVLASVQLAGELHAGGAAGEPRRLAGARLAAGALPGLKRGCKRKRSSTSGALGSVQTAGLSGRAVGLHAARLAGVNPGLAAGALPVPKRLPKRGDARSSCLYASKHERSSTSGAFGS